MLTLCLLLMAAGPSDASALTYLAQERFVSLEDVGGGTLVRVDSPDFEDFDSVLGADEVIQQSSLGADQINVRVYHEAAASVRNEHYIVESYFSTTFEILEPSEYELQYELAILGYVTDIAGIFPWFDLQLILETSLTGPAGDLVSHSFNLHDDCAPQLNCAFLESAGETGFFTPGTYTLVARSYAEVSTDEICIGIGCSIQRLVGSSTDGLVDVVLFVPEPSRMSATVALACLVWMRRQSPAARVRRARLY